MADAGEKEKKKGGKLKWIILGVLLLVLAGGGYFAYTKFFAGGGDAPADQAAADAQKAAEDGKVKKEGKSQVVTLPTFLVNLADPLGRRYLKLTIDVEVEDETAAMELEGATAKVRDKLILLLSSLTYADLASLESKILLKTKIVNNLNQVLGGSKVQQVYFTDMVIQ